MPDAKYSPGELTVEMGSCTLRAVAIGFGETTQHERKVMKRLNASMALALVAALSVCFAGDQGKSKADPAMEEMMKKAEAAGMPGPAHKVLDALVGDWNADVRFWMAPDAPPTESKGTSKVRWTHNGRFVQEDFSGSFMGKPFNGTSITGYDNVKQKYVNVWLDDMGTGITLTEGAAGKDGKVFTFEGNMSCPATGEKDKAIKYVLRIQSRDKHSFEMHDPTLGEKSKTGEITYTRK
jgi:uncharacterized protein DUF1579